MTVAGPVVPGGTEVEWLLLIITSVLGFNEAGIGLFNHIGFLRQFRICMQRCWGPEALTMMLNQMFGQSGKLKYTDIKKSKTLKRIFLFSVFVIKLKIF